MFVYLGNEHVVANFVILNREIHISRKFIRIHELVQYDSSLGRCFIGNWIGGGIIIG